MGEYHIWEKYQCYHMCWDFVLQFWSLREGRLRYSKGIMASAPQATVLQPLEVKRCKKENER